MERVLEFTSLKEHYDADACIVWCFDDRFFKLLDAFIKQQGLKNVDIVKSAGGAKALAADGGTDRDFILNQMKLSAALHEKLGSAFLRRVKDITERQIADLETAGKTILGLASHPVEVDRYYLKFSNPEKTQVVFDKL